MSQIVSIRARQTTVKRGTSIYRKSSAYRSASNRIGQRIYSQTNGVITTRNFGTILEGIACSKGKGKDELNLTAAPNYPPSVDSEIIELIPDMVCVADITGEVVRVNRITKKNMGRTGIGESLTKFLSPDSAKEVIKEIFRLFDSENAPKYVEGRAIGVTTDGKEIPLWYLGTLVRGPDGTPYMAAIIRDISKLVASEEESHRRDFLARRFAPSLLRELRGALQETFKRLIQPLKIVSEDLVKPEFVKSIREGSEEEALKKLDQVARGASGFQEMGQEKLEYFLRMIELLESILGGKEEPKVEKLPIYRWLMRFIAHHGRFSTAVHLNIYSKLNIGFCVTRQEGELKEAYLDPSALDLVLRGLITNAIEYNKELDVLVTLDVRRDDKAKEFVFTITDDGPGVPDNIIDLQKLTLKDTHLKSSVDHYAFTLLEAKKTIKKHGGRLEISNRAIEGTEVTVRIPLVHPMVRGDLIKEHLITIEKATPEERNLVVPMVASFFETWGLTEGLEQLKKVTED